MVTRLIVCAVASLCALGPARSEPESGSPTPTGPAGPKHDPKGMEPDGRRGWWDHSKDRGPRPMNFDQFPKKFREQFEQLPKQDRERFMANWQRWRSMGEEERSELMKKAFADRQRVEETISGALKKLNLELDRDEREVFELRYRQERRKIEEKLHAEIDRQRAALTGAMLEDLKREFAPMAAAPAKPEATATPQAPTPAPAAN